MDINIDWADMLNEELDEDFKKRNKLDVYFRALKRLVEFSDNCEVCCELISQGENLFDDYLNKSDQDKNAIWIEFSKYYKSVIKHLEKEHTLVLPGHYVNVYLSLGVSLGLIFGMSFDNLAIGIAFGLSIGIAIGSSLDSNAKHNNRVI